LREDMLIQVLREHPDAVVMQCSDESTGAREHDSVTPTAVETNVLN